MKLEELQKTTEAIAQFPKLVESYSSQQVGETCGDLLRKISILKDSVVETFDQNAIREFLQCRQGLLEEYIKRYMVARLCEYMPVLDPAFYRLRRKLWLNISATDKATLVDDRVDDLKPESKDLVVHETSLVVRARLFSGDPTIDLGKPTRTVSYSTYALNLNTKLPGIIGKNLRFHYAKALGKYFRLMAEVMDNPETSDLLLTHTTNNEHGFGVPSIEADWIPPSLLIRSGDAKLGGSEDVKFEPIMVLWVFGTAFVVTHWTIDQPDDFNAVLKEFIRKEDKQ